MSRFRSQRVFVVGLALAAAACDHAAPGAHPGGTAALPPPQPFQASGGEAARGWAVPPEYSGEVLSRTQQGEKLEDVLADIEARHPGTVGGKGAAAAAPAIPAAPAMAPAQPVAGSEKAAVEKVRKRWELMTGQQVAVQEVEAVSGLWRIAFQLAGDQEQQLPLRQVFVSQDARLLFEQGVLVDAELDRFEADRAFARCLRDRGVRAYLDPRSKTGAEQVAALGRFGGLVLVDCSETLQACVAAGARTLPVVMMGDTQLQGVQDRAALTALTGCK